MAILLADEHIAKLSRALPDLKRGDAYKAIPIAVGSVTMNASPKDVTLANVVATDTVVISVVNYDTTEAAPPSSITATAAAGKITITSDEVTTGNSVINYVVYRV